MVSFFLSVIQNLSQTFGLDRGVEVFRGRNVPASDSGDGSEREDAPLGVAHYTMLRKSVTSCFLVPLLLQLPSADYGSRILWRLCHGPRQYI